MPTLPIKKTSENMQVASKPFNQDMFFSAVTKKQEQFFKRPINKSKDVWSDEDKAKLYQAILVHGEDWHKVGIVVGRSALICREFNWQQKQREAKQMRLFKALGNQCLCCGIFGSDNVSLEYDHINCATKHDNLSSINVDSEEFNVDLRQVHVLCY